MSSRGGERDCGSNVIMSGYGKNHSPDGGRADYELPPRHFLVAVNLTERRCCDATIIALILRDSPSSDNKMAIHIIVDGYNLIGSETGLRGDIEGKRGQLVQKLQRYKEQREYPITVVFDGWRSGRRHETEEKTGGITVIYSQLGEKADSVIQRLAREMGSGCVVVTSDREVRRAAETSGAVAIHAGEFSAKLRNLDREHFFEDEDKDEGLEDLRVQEKRGNPRRLSKKERKRREKLKKL